MKLNFFDRIVAFFSPQSAVKRVKARMQIDYARKFDGASTGRLNKNWNAPGSSANTEAFGQLPTLRNRARDMVRNNAYMARAVQVIASSVVGDGIIHKFLGPTKKAKAISEKWKAWAESKDCDFYGKHNYYGLQAMIMREVVESGECLVRKIKTPSSMGLPVPFQLQVLEGDHLDVLKKFPMDANTNNVLQSIEFDKQGRIVAYHIYKKHPGEIGFNLEIERVPATEMIHIFRPDRAAQIRGIPWAAPVMTKLNDFGDMENAQLTRQKIAACFVGVVYDVDGIPTEGQGGADLPIDKFEPGSWEVLPPGKDIKFSSPPGVDGYREYSLQMLHAIASGFGITYESLTGDFSQVNFSSARMGVIEMYKNINQWRWHMLIPQFCEEVGKWFLDALYLVGINSDGITQDFTEPRREMIDPNTETNSIIKQIRAGLLSQSEAIRESGRDPEVVLTEIAADNKQLDSLKIVLDTDPRQVTQQGLAQQGNSNGGGSIN